MNPILQSGGTDRASKPAKRTRNLYNPSVKTPFALSRTRLENFIRCPRCFYLDRRLGIDQPPTFPYTLNSAVDVLFKKEFDVYRAKQKPHPLMEQYGINAIPYNHKDLEIWRDPFKGIRYHDPGTNFILTGGIDDIWENSSKELIIVDYKSTCTDGEVSLEGDFKESYKRQIEIYQWLFRKNGFPISKDAYFVYTNALKSEKGFFDQLKFKTIILKHIGDDSWVDSAVSEAHRCLSSNETPAAVENCSFCKYRVAAREAESQTRASI